MKKFCFTFLFLFSLKATSQNINLYKEFGESYIDALIFLNKNKWIFDSIRKNEIEPAIAISIVFPEIIRYNSIRDFIEVSALKTLYVQYGHKYADFSIGYFQMKPSFAEQVEKDWMKLKHTINIHNLNKITFDTNSTIESRRQRIMRLDDLIWQVTYLCIFLHIVNYFFPGKDLGFYATTYNYSYKQSEAKIRSIGQKANFSTTILPGIGKKYKYSEISTQIYNVLKNNMPK